MIIQEYSENLAGLGQSGSVFVLFLNYFYCQNFGNNNLQQSGVWTLLCSLNESLVSALFFILKIVQSVQFLKLHQKIYIVFAGDNLKLTLELTGNFLETISQNDLDMETVF